MKREPCAVCGDTPCTRSCAPFRELDTPLAELARVASRLTRLAKMTTRPDVRERAREALRSVIARADAMSSSLDGNRPSGRRAVAERDGSCDACGAGIRAGDQIRRDRVARLAVCSACSGLTPIDAGLS